MGLIKKYKNALLVIIILLILIFTIGVGKVGGEASTISYTPRIFEPPHMPLPYQTFVADFIPYPDPTASPTPSPTNKPKPKPKATARAIYRAPRAPSVKEAQKYALNRVGRAQYNCLYLLWQHESGWRTHAYNRSSGAYGIPQALPGRKMASAGSDWRDNPITQVKWGLGYIRGRYGNSCNAWQHARNTGWY